MPSIRPEQSGFNDESSFDHDSDPNFLGYYSEASLSDETLGRFRRVRDNALRLLARSGGARESLRVADIGCGAGTSSRLWAELGHQVHGLDVNRPLIELARARAREAGLTIRFDVASATDLPYADESMGVVLMPELLEHVVDWEVCLNHAVRVLAPGGLLFLSTTNVLCPMQQEYSLPMYSWYPAAMKRRFERLAVTTRPGLVSYAKYPAVNWFSFYGLRNYLDRIGLDSMDRFDAADAANSGPVRRAEQRAIRAVPLFRLVAHVLTPGLTVYAIKRHNH